MANPSYLIKVGSYTIPLSVMKTETYSVTRSTLDLDSYRDADGILHRTVLAHKVPKIEFETPISHDLPTLLANIKAQYTDTSAKTCNVSYWDFEQGSFQTATCYVPDISVKIKENSLNGFLYESCRIAFIGY